MQIRCSNCGADVSIKENSQFIKCPYCNAGLFVDLASGIRHYYKKSKISGEGLDFALKRFLLTHEIIGNFKIVSSKRSFIPFWRFAKRDGTAELISATTPLSEDLAVIDEPEGRLLFFSDEVQESLHAVPPEIFLDAARAKACALNIGFNRNDEKAVALIHLPVYLVSYLYNGATCHAVIDGVAGAVFADEMPKTPEKTKSRILGAVTLVSFFIFFVQTLKLPSLWLFFSFPLTGIAVFYTSGWLLKKMGW
jgi:hypothetical protein